MIGERTAETIKIQLGSASLLEKPMTMEIKGRDLVAGVPKTVEISDEEIRDSLLEPINQIVEAVRIALERTPPELASDIVDKGIVLAGGSGFLGRRVVEDGRPVIRPDIRPLPVHLGGVMDGPELGRQRPVHPHPGMAVNAVKADQDFPALRRGMHSNAQVKVAGTLLFAYSEGRIIKLDETVETNALGTMVTYEGITTVIPSYKKTSVSVEIQ
jgi:cell division ATPase FtsA